MLDKYKSMCYYKVTKREGKPQKKKEIKIMKTYKITLTDNTEMFFDVYVDAPNAERACEAVATAGLFVVEVKC